MRELFKRAWEEVKQGWGKAKAMYECYHFGSRGLKTRMTLGKRPIRTYPQGLGEGALTPVPATTQPCPSNTISLRSAPTVYFDSMRTTNRALWQPALALQLLGRCWQSGLEQADACPSTPPRLARSKCFSSASSNACNQTSQITDQRTNVHFWRARSPTRHEHNKSHS
jgi:hypothetical protein